MEKELAEIKQAIEPLTDEAVAARFAELTRDAEVLIPPELESRLEKMPFHKMIAPNDDKDLLEPEAPPLG